MAIKLNDNLKINAPKLTEERMGPFASLGEALLFIPLVERCEGMTFYVREAGSPLGIEYWWPSSDVSNDGVIVKTIDTNLFQPLDADLTAIAALPDNGTGFLKKTNTNTWVLDNTTYVAVSALDDNGGNIPTMIGGKIKTSQLPALAITDTFVCSSEAQMLALIAERGDVCVRTDVSKTFILKDNDPTILANWEQLLHPMVGNTDDIVELPGATNQYFTVARARNSINVTTVGTGGAATYDPLTGLINIPQYQTQLINPVTGTGAAGRVTFWTSESLIGSDSSFIWDNTFKYLGLGINPSYRLHIDQDHVFSSSGNISSNIYARTIVPASSTFTSGSVWASSMQLNSLLFDGTSTINSGAIVGGAAITSRYGFSTAGTITQSATHMSGLRAVSTLHILPQFVSNVSGTINSAAGAIIQGMYTEGSGVLTLQNYYGLIINPVNEWGGLNVVNGWGIYQVGPTERNFFAGNIGIGVDPTERLDVDGKVRVRNIAGAYGDVVTVSATGVLQKRTINELITDLGVNNVVSSTSGVAGRIPFFSSATNLNTDAGLVWDNVNKRLGVGTNTPLGPIHINSDITANSNGLTITRTGVLLSDANFQITNGTNIVGQFLPTFLFTSNWSSSGPTIGGFISARITNTNPQDIGIILEARTKLATSLTQGYILSIRAFSTDYLRVAHNGNVIIQNGGTFTDAGFRLDVNGTGRFTSTLRVDTVNNSAGDFLTRDVNGVITRRTAAQVLFDIGAQASLNGTGFVRLVGTTLSYISGTASQFVMADGTFSSNPGWLTSETDPTVPSHVKGITTTDISNWNTAFGWGNHTGLYVPLTRTLNGLALSANQTFLIGTTGTDFNINSTGTTHTFNIPNASATNRGLVTTGSQTFAGVKTFNGNIILNNATAVFASNSPNLPFLFQVTGGATTLENNVYDFLHDGTVINTSGTVNLLRTRTSFQPNTGNGIFNSIAVNTIINQTGTANGITRGIHIAPTLTSAVDWRAIESTNGRWILTDTYSSGSGSLANPSLDINATWNTTGVPSLIRANLTNTASDSGGVFIDFLLGGVRRFAVNTNGVLIFSNGTRSTTIRTENDNTTSFSSGQNGAGDDFRFGNGSGLRNYTSGNGFVMTVGAAFIPTSGTGQLSVFHANPTINQTGGANGITRGLLIDPILTSAADWRSIQWTNNTGTGLFGSGTASNWLRGRTVLGGSSFVDNGTDQLQVTGTVTISSIPARITAATIFLTTNGTQIRSRTIAQVLSDIGAVAANSPVFTGAPTFSTLGGSGTRLFAVDNTGLSTAITIGSGLSLTGSTLSATGGSSGTVTGTGTAGVIPLWNSSSDIGNSALTQAGGNITASGQFTATQFNGSGAGLTGTATSLNIGGNAATVTNGVYTNGSYVNPSWITSLDWSKITGAPSFITGNQTISLLGDVTGSGATSITTTISNGAVTYPKMQNMTTARMLGRVTAGSGVIEELTAAQIRTLINVADGATANVGTVTSVSGTGSVSGLTLTGNVTSSGSLTLGGTLSVLPSNFSPQTANTFLAAPNGTSGVPTFRAIVAADIPTLNQNTTGNAATASNATLWSGLSFTDSQLSNPTFFLTSTGGGNWRFSSVANIQSTLGLGSYAYRSSGLAELSGANFTDAISGTSASFSSTITTNGNLNVFNGLNGEILLGNNPTYRGRIYYDGSVNGQLIFDNTYNSTNGNSGFVFRTRTSGTPVDALRIEGNGRVITQYGASAGSTSYTQAGFEVYTNTFSQTNPRISFHWGSVVASQIALESDGTIAIVNNPGTAYEKFKASSATLTSTLSVTGNTTVGALYTNTFQMVNATNFSFNNVAGTQLATLSHSTGNLALNYGLTVAGAATFSSSATFGDNVTISTGAGTYPRYISTVGAKSWEIGYRSGTTSYEVREDGTTRFAIANGGAITASSSITATSFIRSGGTSSQALMADGSTRGMNQDVLTTSNVTFNQVTATNGGFNSDIKDKTNIIRKSIKGIESLRGASYLRISTGLREYGYIAQEVQAILPEAVYENKGGLALSYHMVNAARIDYVQDELTMLKQQVALLKNQIRELGGTV